jgi:hypothetical protein
MIEEMEPHTLEELSKFLKKKETKVRRKRKEKKKARMTVLAPGL